MKLKDRVAVITGAGRGIGQTTALAMAKEGARVAVLEIAEPRAKETAQKINQSGGKAIALQVDVADNAKVKEAADRVIEEFGRVDILVNNAGIGQVELFTEGNEERWERIIAVNLKGTIVMTRAVIEGMVQRKHGKIINIASVAGMLPANKQVVYGASKGGVIAFTRSLSAEMSPYHINVNAICPGNVETPLFAKGRELLPAHLKPYYKMMEDDIPWGRMGLPEDIAKVAVFLASDDAEYITGQAIAVDGGVTHYPHA